MNCMKIVIVIIFMSANPSDVNPFNCEHYFNN
jgi:hypothetical protein